MNIHLMKIGIVLLLSCVATAAQEKAENSIDSAKSKLEINVYKEGVFKAFGHNHLIIAKQISGGFKFDAKTIESSVVNLRVETKSLTVSPQGEPEKDRRDVQTTMIGEEILDVARYPEIVFSSTGVSAVKTSADGWTLTLTGKLTLHGVEKPVRLPVAAHVNGNQMQAQGEVSLLQTDYGIKPVKAGGGAVTVKDELKISFDIAEAK